MKKITTSINLSPDMLAWIKQRAEEDDRSMNAVIVRLIAAAMKRK